MWVQRTFSMKDIIAVIPCVFHISMLNVNEKTLIFSSFIRGKFDPQI